jgi:2-dehydro-3-deoxyphosphogluconate aldolase/(4S)-4-hydroxy-2-oxoglutarate aldolase
MRPELDIVSILLRSRLVGIIRSATPVDLVEVCRSLHAGGVKCVEITLNSPGALHAIERVRADLPAGCIIGAGTVLDVDTAKQALAAGAQFIVTPVVDLPTIELVRSRNIPVLPGAYSPTEVYTAWKAGATLVKLFPASNLGIGYLREVMLPLPELRLCPTGGVNLRNAREWLDAGAASVGVGTSLMPRDLVLNGDFAGITRLAAQWAELTAPTNAALAGA